MKFSSALVLTSVAALTEAVPQAPSAAPAAAAAAPASDGKGGCPAVWTQVSAALTKIFVGTDGQCTDLARAAIRASFHDCGTWNKAQGMTGGCDGSLILSAEENARSANRGLQQISGVLKNMATQFNVGVADMIAFAGAHGTVSCPLGPTVKTVVGRKDSSQAAPNEDLLPSSATLSADQILTLMADKGFNGPDTAALVGAHSSARQFFADPSKAGQPQDTTPGIWDVAFYGQTSTKPPGVFVFQSDVNLSKDPRSGPTFQSFVGQQAQWNAAFADTFARLNVLGVPQAGLIDCTAALPPPRDTFPGANPPAGNAPSPSQGGPSPSQGGPGQGPPSGRPTGRPDSGAPTQGQPGRPTYRPGQGPNNNGPPAKKGKVRRNM